MPTIRWQKSTYSGDGSNCIEIAVTSIAIHVRDSKDVGRPPFTVQALAWSAFVAHVGRR